MTYELIDHTGDIGVVARAPTLESLFAEFGRAMFAILAESSSSAKATEDIAVPAATGADDFPVGGVDPAGELRDFLSELLYRFSADHRMYVAFTPGTGAVTAAWEPYDTIRHPLRTELKAVTYHQLEVVREGEQWRGRVIFDV